MKRVLTAVILVPIVILALFKAPLWLFTLLVFGVAVLAAHEYFGIVKAQGFRPFRTLSYLIMASLFGFVMWGSLEIVRQMPSWLRSIPMVEGIAGLLLVAAPYLLMIFSMRRDPLSRALPDSAVSFLLLPYVGLSLVCLVLLRAYESGALFVLFLVLVPTLGIHRETSRSRARTPHQHHLRMYMSRKANTSGSQIFTPRKGKACPSSGVCPIGG